ncbi:transcription termination factor MTEF1, chloroplastic [Cucurbita maxima]|uniref:Transcription termination factor MTEF1, chloroplastic n=1 Tax=Cucurbita maxima TaxID=3661 RepID=A0A6J1IAF5_CUCMA|nr:transcription termination factor MTEF1, chloroplastic [Cucurbita maxima]
MNTMQDTALHLLSNGGFLHHSSPSSLFPSLSRSRTLQFPIISNAKTAFILPSKLPSRAPDIPPLSPPLPPPPSHSGSRSEFQEKMLFLDSIGIDFLSVIKDHPPVATASLADIRSAVDFMTSMNFTAVEFRRIVGMCPEILTSRVSDIVPVFTFLLREARVDGSDIKRVINRRPRLLACSVKNRLRPTMYFLQSIGISEVHKHTSLLSCSVEEKLIPRIEFFENLGFSRRDAVIMFRRFPQLFCCSIKENLEPKLNYFVVEMGRELKELKEFPHYFSFSLENRIKPRHQICVEKGVCFPLPVLLKTSEMKFREKLEPWE